MTDTTIAAGDLLQVTRAARFACEAHAHQRRKGEAAEPYVNHLAEVAELLAEVTNGADANLICAGWLHDTVEDCCVTFEELAERFGEDVATLVRAVTDDKSLEKAERKRLQVVNAPGKPPRAKMLKLADKTSNLRAIAKSPPADWSHQRKAEYLRWACEVAEGLRGVNAVLEGAFDEAAGALDVTTRSPEHLP